MRLDRKDLQIDTESTPPEQWFRLQAGKRKKLSYRVIIADDEKKILQLIKLLGRWEQFGIEIIDECYDGRQTLESIKKNRPDFVISDIKMPELDGIELMRETKEEGIDCRFILLSGYRHFEYARSAIALNVVDYLLKPIEEEQLNHTLEKVCVQIKKSREEKQNMENLLKLQRKQKYEEKMSAFWEWLMERRRPERILVHAYTKEQCNEEYGTGFLEECYQIVMISSNISGVIEQGASLFEDTLEGAISKYLKSCASCCHYVTFRGSVIIINYAEKNKKKVEENIAALYYEIRDLNEIYGEFRLNFGVSSTVKDIKKLKRAFGEAQAAEWGRLVTTQNGVLYYSQISGLKPVSREQMLGAEELERLKSSVKYLRREELSDLFQTLFDRALSHGNCAPGDLAAVYFEVMDSMLEVLSEEEQQIEEKWYYAYLEAISFSQAIKNLYLAVDSFLEEKQRQVKQKNRKPISEAVRYIHENFAKTISQEEAARASNVSVTYLSKLFKEEMGMGFTEYVTKVRLEESEKFLADTAMSIKEIAVAVGYPDEKYFSKLFKKNTGIKPTEYRKIYG